MFGRNFYDGLSEEIEKGDNAIKAIILTAIVCAFTFGAVVGYLL